MYLVKSPWFFKKIYPKRIWNINTSKKIIYLTFDDGPHPTITPFVLEVLQNYQAKATFFCIGDNVNKFPELYQSIKNQYHKIGNHTYNHLNGWKTTTEDYIKNILLAEEKIESKLFRPPYGKLTSSQSKHLQQLEFKIIMWNVLSGDFDKSINRETCYKNVTTNAKSGSIVVFHDSEKAFEKLQFALPKTLKYFTNQGYTFESLPDL